MYLNSYKVIKNLSDESICGLLEIMNITSGDRQEINDEIKTVTQELSDLFMIINGTNNNPTNVELWFEFIEMCFDVCDGDHETPFSEKEEKIYKQLQMNIQHAKEMKVNSFLDVVDELVDIYRDFVTLTYAMLTGKHTDYVAADSDVNILFALLREILECHLEAQQIQGEELIKKIKKDCAKECAKTVGISALGMISALSGAWVIWGGSLALELLHQNKLKKKDKKNQEYEAYHLVNEYTLKLIEFGKYFSALIYYLRKDIMCFDE